VVGALFEKCPWIGEATAFNVLRKDWNPSISDADLRLAVRREKHGPPKMTTTALAIELGCSRATAHSYINEGGPSREMAERIAALRGGEPEDYLRGSRRRGRRRPYPFKQFVFEEEGEGGTEQDAADCVILNLAAIYDGLPLLANGRKYPRPPDDFESLEALIGFARGADFARDSLDVVWKRFRVWREYQLYLERVWAIENDEV